MSTPGLTAVAAWDTALLDGAVYTLEAVAERLPPWRARVEDVARTLADARVWYGPAAQEAAAALGEVSSVVTAVTGALGASLERLWDTAREARTAQELAEQALAEAAVVPVALEETGAVVPSAPVPLPAEATAAQVADHTAELAERAAAAQRVAGLATDALFAAARAALHTSTSAEPLAAVGGHGPVVPADFAGLSAAVGRGAPFAPVLTPLPTTPPEAVASWWANLPEPARTSLIASDPAAVGSLDGVPAWARDRANRLLLQQTLGDPGTAGYATARAAAAEIEAEEAAGRPVQLWVFDPAQDLVAVAYGDLDTAEDVGLLVPGMGNVVGEDLDDLGDRAHTVADATLAAAPAAAVATVAWFGYRPPAGLGSWQAARREVAQRGGIALAGDLAGLAAARAADPVRAGDPRVTVLAHSYGTVVVDEAGDLVGELDVDAVVLLGSPGIEEYRSSDLEAAEVYDASSPSDPVSYLGRFGTSTWERSFGSAALPTDWDTGHGDYYAPDHPTVAAMGEVVAGTRQPG
ncbi:alpha/beta hydrolase [Geodermatophilus maliterrae]|uniref:Alpha/beta hydrolase n=1 Tax=Geodermatophilus maliterrae TaxID=3162531 RepID=A0ABV3XFS5_9ACTN